MSNVDPVAVFIAGPLLFPGGRGRRGGDAGRRLAGERERGLFIIANSEAQDFSMARGLEPGKRKILSVREKSTARKIRKN